MKIPIFIFLFTIIIFMAGINISLCDDITIVTINKETVEKIGPYPFSRDRYADFIEAIYGSYNPKCVYFNLLISQYQQGSMESNQKLFYAINKKQNIFFSAMVSNAVVEHSVYTESQLNDIKYNRVWRAEGAVFPLPEMTRNGAYTAISDVGLNKKGIVEMMPTLVQIDGYNYLSTPLFLTIKYLGISPADIFSGHSLGTGIKKVRSDRNGWFEIDFNHTFQKYSYHEVLNQKVHKEMIDSRVILFGIDFPELESYLRISNSKKIAGVEVIANATQTLIDQLR